MMNEGTVLLACIGGIFVSTLLIGIPVLTTLAFVLNWYGGTKFILTILFFGEYIALISVFFTMCT